MITDDELVRRHLATINKTYAEGHEAGLRETANWLRRQANAETNQEKKSAFIEAANAILSLAEKNRWEAS